MMKAKFRHFVLVVVLSWLGFRGASAASADSAVSYSVTGTMKVGGDGGWDYATIDAQGRFLYLPRATRTMVVDTSTGKVVGDIPGNLLAHGVALVPDAGRGFISDGRDGSVQIFDLKTNALLGKVKAAADADGIIYDPASNRVIVVCGDAHELFPIRPDVDPVNGKAEPAVELGGKPEFLVSDGKGKVYVNLTDKAEVVVLDTKEMKLGARWPLAPGASPTGMSMDRANGRLFSGCRNGKMIVLDSSDGKVLASLPIGTGVDATLFDRGNAFASCVDGTLTVAHETSPGKFEVVQTVKTAAGARTMAVDANTGKIYLTTADMAPAAPSTGPSGVRGRPQPIPGTFRILIVEPGSAAK